MVSLTTFFVNQGSSRFSAEFACRRIVELRRAPWHLADALEPPVRAGPIRRADEAGRRLVADELPVKLGRLPAGRKPRKDGTAKARKGNGREIPARCAKRALGTHPFSDRCLENLWKSCILCMACIGEAASASGSEVPLVRASISGRGSCALPGVCVR